MEFNSSVNIHNISGLVKLWLRELPEPALTFEAYPRFLAAFRGSKPGILSHLVPSLHFSVR